MLHCTAQIAQLREVHLLRNVIGDAGAAAFGRTVGSGATVHVLALGSRITDMGFEALGEGIARSAHLRELLVSDNSISPEVRQPCADMQRGADGGTTRPLERITARRPLAVDPAGRSESTAPSA